MLGGGLDIQKGMRISSWEERHPNEHRSLYSEFFDKLKAFTNQVIEGDKFLQLLKDHNLVLEAVRVPSLGTVYNFAVVRIYDDNGEEIGEVDPSIYQNLGNNEGFFFNLDTDLDKLLEDEITELHFQTIYWINSREDFEALIKFYRSTVGFIKLDLIA